MALLAICKNGREVIGDNLVRGYYTKNGSLILEGDYFSNSPLMNKDNFTDWISPYYNPDEGCEDIAIELPRGTIRNLTGRELTWNDEPIKLT